VVDLYHEFRALRPEVVHAWLDWGNVRAGLAAVLAGVPRILLSCRNLNPSHFALNADYFHPAYSALIDRNAGQVIMLNNSQAGASDYAGWLSLPRERIKVIRNGVRFSEETRPTPEHNVAWRARLGIPPAAPVVGGMFRLNPEKQPLLWLNVAGRVAQALPEAHFVIFGTGAMRPQMEKAIRALGIASRTHLCGVVSSSLNGLSPCDLILLTSSGEGTPNVLLEAQWLGLPVVTTDAGGAGEAVLDGVTGVVVKTGEAGAIADAVVRVLRDKALRESARHNGAAFVNASYGMERMIMETLAAYGTTPPLSSGLCAQGAEAHA
jgi:glycosyltransferase involved in cell wall biosynthesis